MTCAGMLMVEGEKRDGSGKIARPYTPVTRDDLCGNQPVCRVQSFLGDDAAVLGTRRKILISTQA